MTQLSSDEITRLLAMVSAAWPHFRVSTEAVLLWQECLGDLPYPLLHTAVRMLICTNTYAPSICEIRERVNAILRPHEVSSLDAWGEVIRAIRRFGRYAEREALASMSPGTAHVAERMGWEELCNSDVDDASVIRGQFCKLYDHYMAEQRRDSLLPEALRSVASPTTKAIERHEEEAESVSRRVEGRTL